MSDTSDTPTTDEAEAAGGSRREEYLTRRMEERGAEIEHLLLVMSNAVEAIHEGRDEYGAMRMLLVALQKHGRA